MKKKFSLEINSPCSENFYKMTPNLNGSFCNSCAKNVIDLSTKTNSEVAKFIAENKNKSICARLKTSQLEEEFEVNEVSKINNFKYAAVVAASVLLTSTVVGQEKELAKTEQGCSETTSFKLGKIAYQETKNISFVLSGKILEKATNKPLSSKKYPELQLYVSGSNVSVKVDAKTGAYSIPLLLDKKTTEISITINSNDSSYSKSIMIELSKIRNNSLILNLSIDSKTEMEKHIILGGLGVNYIDSKKIKNS
ncbi:hypothetical protein [Flavobacterium sp.]|uniref:hypothetical protein n=1 Tax=Flavobacterium sp. TaxID=239 RepID=UPI0022BD3DC4|nr:hypothetical protein [Flavobacterium sp.]MCZ8091325.1 hypothetical protein [Flavobacterium sp.]